MAEPAADLVYDNDFAAAAALIADPTRAAILSALLPGRPLAAGELARVAGVGAATASFHLAKLLDGGLLSAVRQGRHRYYTLAGYRVAAALEALGLISPAVPPRSLRQSREARALADARTCYDHLAGRLGVALLDAMLDRGLLRQAGSRDFAVTPAGEVELMSLCVDVGQARRTRRQFAVACLDWTQRRHHLSGALGAAITSRLFELGWIERGPGRRGVLVTEAGAAGLAAAFGLAS